MWNRCTQVMPHVGTPVLISSKGVHRVAIWNGMRWCTQYGSGLSGPIEFWCEIPELVVERSADNKVVAREAVACGQAEAESLA